MVIKKLCITNLFKHYCANYFGIKQKIFAVFPRKEKVYGYFLWKLGWHTYCIKEEQDIKQFYVANSENRQIKNDLIYRKFSEGTVSEFKNEVRDGLCGSLQCIQKRVFKCLSSIIKRKQEPLTRV
jgi:hypothetical protein